MDRILIRVYKYGELTGWIPAQNPIRAGAGDINSEGHAEDAFWRGAIDFEFQGFSYTASEELTRWGPTIKHSRPPSDGCVAGHHFEIKWAPMNRFSAPEPPESIYVPVSEWQRNNVKIYFVVFTKYVDKQQFFKIAKYRRIDI